MMIVADTNVISELMRSSPSPDVVAWVRSHDPTEMYTTSITAAEIHYGIQRLPDGHRKEVLETAAALIFDSFRENVLPFDAAAAIHYATIVSEREQAGLPIDGFDAQIAAICRSHQATLATRNVKDFLQTGIDILNPWE